MWLKKTKYRLYKWRAAWRKRRRLMFPSPAEVELIRIMGGKCIIIDHVKDRRTGFPLVIVTSMGRILKRELIMREVRVGAMYLDFAVATPWYKKGIEVDGKQWHQDIVQEQQRDDYLRQYGWQLLHIQAASIYREPSLVQRRILKFLAS